MEKYGRENFIWGLVEQCDESLANERECDIIREYATFSHGYNSTIGGSTFKKHSPETKAKMSATWKSKGTSNRKGKKNSEESNAKRRATMLARKEAGLYCGRPKGSIPWNKK
jgi:hypothetical protein